ncbi:MAG: RNA 2'-phosphotransferase [Pseudomonadota bacterium]
MSKQSKFLSLILRHKPDLAGLKLGPGGWVQVDDLLRGMKNAGHALRPDELRTLVAKSDKKRFTLSEDGRRIRAAQGHSVPVDLGLEPLEPPAGLFHGTARANLDAIFAEGLKPGRRQHVHLSPDEQTAVKVGQRHGKPVVLRVDTGRMHGDGIAFWRADNGVWLTDYAAPRYIAF